MRENNLFYELVFYINIKKIYSLFKTFMQIKKQRLKNRVAAFLLSLKWIENYLVGYLFKY